MARGDSVPAGFMPLHWSREFLGALFNHRRLLIFSLILLSAALQTAVMQFLPPAAERNTNGDYHFFYGPVAKNLAAGKGLTDSRGNFATAFPPGFPVMLAFQFKAAGVLGIEPLVVVAIFNVLTSALGSACVFLIAEYVFIKRVAVFAALAWAFYPANIWLSFQPNSEVPYLPVFFLAVFASLRALNEKNPRYAAKAGILLGLCALIRPLALPSAAFLAMGLVLFSWKEDRKSGFAGAALLTAGFLLAILPWELYVAQKTGRPLPMFAKGASVMTDGVTSVIADTPRNATGPVDLGKTKRSLVGLLYDELKADPVAVSKLLFMKLTRGWYATFRPRKTHQILPVQIAYLCLGIAGLRLALRNDRRHLACIWLLLFSIAGAWFTTIVTVALLRYMLPQMSFVLIFCAFACDQFLFARAGAASPSPA